MNLSLSLLIMLLLAFPLMGIGLLALYERLRSSHRPLKERDMLIFVLDVNMYIRFESIILNKCPCCQQLNEVIT